MIRTLRCSWLCVWLAFSLNAAGAAATTNVLIWNKAKDRVDADVRGWELLGLLERIALETGWQVYVEPDSGHKASVKFKDLPSGEALRLLLGDLNFALVPQTNSGSRLYVFRTVMRNATQLVHDGAKAARNTEPRRVPNELIVRFKPGVDVEKWARENGAKIIGRIPELDAYRLQFDDETAAESARAQLLASSDVTSVQDNYYVDIPPGPQQVTGVSAPEIKLQLDPPSADKCKVVIGIVDTAVQPLGSDLERFIKERVSVVGDSTTDHSSPLHGTVIVNTLIQALQAVEKTKTSVQFLPVNAFSSDGSANTFNVASAMITAGNKGATVINASLGGYGDSPLMRDAVQQLSDHGIPVFAAVGNDASSNPFFPAAYPQVISVTALDRGRVASYANVGTQADAAAPGTVVFSFNGQTYASQGTSVSTAVATGIAAGIADSSCAPWAQVIPTIRKNLAVPPAP